MKINKRLKHEIEKLTLYFLFFFLFFCAFTFYRSLILKEYDIGYVSYGYNLLEALILSKIIMLGEALNLGERFSERSLIIPTLYKTTVFSIFTLFLTSIEHIAKRYLHGSTLTESYQKLLSVDIYEIIGRLLVMIFVFILFFAFIETGRVLGNNKLLNLFFRRGKE